MEIIVGKLAGFCYGVKNAVTKTEEIVNKNNEVYCVGELVHNKQVVENLEAKGMKVVENVSDVPNGKEVIFRAHGMPQEAFIEAKEKDLIVNNLACPNVILVQEKAKKAKDDFFVILVGKKSHPENIATISNTDKDNSYILEDEDDILECYQKYEESNRNKVYVLFQTTFNTNRAEKIAKEIEHEFCETDVIVDNTICMATESRQIETRNLAQKVDKMVIIGGKNSSNTLKLVEISKEFCKNVYHVETKEELKKEDFNLNDKIGIMAGASTPKTSIDDVKAFLENI